MKFSEQWLREWVNPQLDTDALCEQLSMAGLEVDAVEPAAALFENIVVAQVDAVEAHPDADKLRVCRVSDGREDLQIVCGAPNVAAGMKVPLARIGAVLPGGMKIKKAKLRGVESTGMLCSAAELGLLEQAEGLLSLPEDAPLGQDVREYLQLDDRIIDIDLTPNRGDCLSIQGVAREVAALNGLPFDAPQIPAVDAVHDQGLDIQIDNAADCSSYTGRVIKGIDVLASTPLWMRERLRRAGIRSIHPVVDVTNYVMLELGQPMHAFDLSRLQGGIQVRRARQGETLTALTGEELKLGGDDLVIADSARPVALAGVMGGLDSGVTAETVDILLESACFSPLAVAGTGRRHKLHTDSLHRFERGVDPALQARAAERATRLILDICGGQPGALLQAGVGAGESTEITLRQARLERLLGFEVPAEQLERILASLGMQLTRTAPGQWQVLPPSFRYDMQLEADLIEEVVRVYGYDRVPDRPQRISMPPMQSSESVLPLQRLREALIHRGYQEVVTYSFVDPEKQAALIPGKEAINLDNPIARQLGQMRTSLWPGLLEVLTHNLQRQQGRVRIFELGMRFIAQGDDILQQRVLSGLVYGPVLPEQWDGQLRTADYYDVKSDLEALFSMSGSQVNIDFEAAGNDTLHPGVSAAVLRHGETLGYLGSMHPRYLKKYDLSESPILFELDLDALCNVPVPHYESISEYPAMRRDLAMVMPDEVSTARLLKCVSDSEEAHLVDAFVFDVFRGAGLPSGCKSVALGLNFQDKSRTLTEQEVDAALSRIQLRLSQELDANIRG